MIRLLAGAAGALAGAGGAALAFEWVGRLKPRRSARTLVLPAPVRAALLRLGEMLSPRIGAVAPAAADVGGRLAAAGDPAGLAPREWVALKCCTAGVMTVCAATAAGALPGRLPLLAFIAAPAAGFVAPEFWLARAVERRLRAAGAELAPMLDLLQVSVSAGASPAGSLGTVGARFSGPLAAEWRAAATAIALGTPHDRALETLTRRLPSPRIRAFADAMRRAQRRGLPLADVLARHAAAARHDQQIRLREQAARAGPKIQLVVAFVLVPSVMLVIAAALIAELTAPGVGLTY